MLKYNILNILIFMYYNIYVPIINICFFFLNNFNNLLYTRPRKPKGLFSF